MNRLAKDPVKVLAQKGANMNIPNSLADSDAYIDGGAPLHLAAMVFFLHQSLFITVFMHINPFFKKII